MTPQPTAPWWRWPEDELNGIVPWFVIVRRAVAWPLLALSMCGMFIALVLGFGFKEGVRTWKDIR